MLEKMSWKFANQLVESGIIDEADADVYMFGFFQMSMLLLNVITSFLIGAAFQLILPCLLLNVAFIPLRTYAGGFHANSPIKCYLYSSAMIAALLAAIKWIVMPDGILLAILMISGVVIFSFAPVDAENNPLDVMEKKIYRKRALLILCIEISCSIFFLILSDRQISQIITLSLLAECLLVLVGKLQNRKRQKILSHSQK